MLSITIETTIKMFQNIFSKFFFNIIAKLETLIYAPHIQMTKKCNNKCKSNVHLWLLWNISWYQLSHNVCTCMHYSPHHINHIFLVSTPQRKPLTFFWIYVIDMTLIGVNISLLELFQGPFKKITWNLGKTKLLKKTIIKILEK
jgi:hypothetical protein